MTMKKHLARMGRLSSVAVLTATLGLTACDMDEMMTVNDPDTVNEDTFNDPELINEVVNGAIGNFTTAYSGNGDDGYLTVSALMSDEFYSSGSFTTRTATDRREQFIPADGNTSDAAYNRLHRARRALNEAAARVADLKGSDDPTFARLKALEGYTYVALAEGFCSAIPFSNGVPGAFEYGAPMKHGDIFSTAAQIFQTAFDATSDANMKNLAAVGLGRALLNRGEYAAAANAVAGVPTDYVYHIRHSVSGASNPIFSLQGNGRYSISDREGINGLPFRSDNDPRVPWEQDPAGGFDDKYELYVSLAHPYYDAPVVLASGVEARLIEAEAAFHAGGDWLGILNDLRSDVANLMAGLVPGYADIVPGATLAPLADPGNDAARVDMIFKERAMWLFLTGHRLGDLRRLVREYGRAENTVYPTGAYHKGGTYGSDVVFPLDYDEEMNPAFKEANGWDLCNVKSVG